MSCKKIAAVMFALAFLVVPMSVSLDLDADPGDITFDSRNVRAGSFNERSNGTVYVPIENTSSAEIELDVNVSWKLDIGEGSDHYESTNVLAERSVIIPAGETVTVELSFRISSPGKHYVTVWIFPYNHSPTTGEGESIFYNNAQNLEINVGSSIWSNTSTYIVIAIVVIVVIVALYLRLRSTRAPKTEGRFTAMETERRAYKETPKKEEYEPAVLPAEDTAAAEEIPKAAAPARTEKQEYTGKVSKTKPKQQSSSKRKSDPSSRKSAKRK